MANAVISEFVIECLLTLVLDGFAALLCPNKNWIMDLNFFFNLYLEPTFLAFSISPIPIML